MRDLRGTASTGPVTAPGAGAYGLAMGSATELGYRHERGNPLQRAVQSIASTVPGAWTFAHLLPPLDRVTHRLTKGRGTLPGVLAGLPTLMVTTTGRRSGEPRTTPLIAVPVGDDLALLGTNFGQPATPALGAEPGGRPARDRDLPGSTL